MKEGLKTKAIMLNTMLIMEENKPFEQKQNQDLISKCNNELYRIKNILKKRYGTEMSIDSSDHLIFETLER